MAAAPAQVDAQGSDCGFDQACCHKHPCRDGDPRRLQHGRLRLAGKHRVGQRHAAERQHETRQDGLGHRVFAHPCRKSAGRTLRRVVHPTSHRAHQGERDKQRDLAHARLRTREAGHAHAAPKHVAEQGKRAKRPCNGEEVHERLLGAGQHKLGLATLLIESVGRTRKRGDEAVEWRSEECGERGLNAHCGECAEVGPKAAQSVAHPGAQACDDARETRLGTDAASKEKRQKRRKRETPQLVVGVAALLLYLRHDAREFLGMHVRGLLVQPDDQTSRHANDQRVQRAPKGPARHPGGNACQCASEHPRQRVPHKRDSMLHEQEEQPNKRASYRACERDAYEEHQTVERLCEFRR